MIILVLALLVTPVTSDAVCKCVTLHCKNQEAIIAIKKQLYKHGAKDMIDPKELAPMILHNAQYFDVDYMTVTKVILVESRGRAKAFNKRTKDYGLMQVNAKTASWYEADVKCLFDWKCNLRLGVEILSNAKRVCNYNLGNSRLNAKRMRHCLVYERKVASIE